MIRCYRHSGVHVASTIDLPEWAGFRDDDGFSADQADVTIALAQGPFAPTEMPDGVAVAEQGWARFDVESVGRWLVSAGQDIVVDPHTHCGAPELRLFTIGTAWAVLGYQRGWLMCHGSVVVPHGSKQAILLTGASGQGKSTAAAGLVAAGGTLLADDLCRIESVAGARALAHPSAGYLKLWGDTVEAFSWGDRITAQDHFRADKFLCAPPSGPMTLTQPVPIGAIVVLGWDEALSFQRFRGTDAIAQVLSAACYRPQAIDVLNAWPGQAKAWLTVLQHTPVYSFRRPKEFAQIDAANRLLEKVQTLP